MPEALRSPARQGHAVVEMLRGPQIGLGRSGEDDTLWEWRRKATDIVLAASAVLHLLPLVLFLAGHAPASTSRFRPATIGAFLVVVAAALARGIDHRVRVWTVLASTYTLAFLGIAAVPDGAYIRSVPISAPVLAIGLVGKVSGRVAMVISGVILVFAPFVGSIPILGDLMGVLPLSEAAIGQTVMQGVGFTTDMLVKMLLLQRFSTFLLERMAAQRRVAEDLGAAGVRLEREADERRRLEREIARIGDEERRRLGHEVHDGVCQQLAGALLRCQALERRLEQGVPPGSADLKALSNLLGETIQEARGVAEGLCPLEATPEALAPALRTLAERTRLMSGIPCEFLSSGDLDVADGTAAQHLYRIAQEALSNAVRHAHAHRLTIELHGAGGALLLQVKDDGVGLPAVATSGGMGLRTMAFRAQALDAELTVEPGRDGGTCVSCRLSRPAATPMAADRTAAPIPGEVRHDG